MNADGLKDRPWFLELARDVQAEISRLQVNTPDRRNALEFERGELEAKSQGWVESLSKPNLNSRLREAIEQQFQPAKDRIDEITSELGRDQDLAARAQELLDPDLIVDQLNRLDEILGRNNPSAGNMILSQHIEGIECDRDGRVVVRTCKLGALAGVMALLPRAELPFPTTVSAGENGIHIATPRKRGRLDIGGIIENDDEASAAIEFATNPNRFTGLGPEWFTEDVYQVPRRLSWAEENARAVAEYRLQNQATMEATSQHFGKTVPTIRQALRYAELLGIAALGKEVSLATRPNWSKENAAAVAAYFSENGFGMKAAVAHFKKSEPTIRKALDFARNQPPDNP
jgi:hypothetical protein